MIQPIEFIVSAVAAELKEPTYITNEENLAFMYTCKLDVSMLLQD